MESKSNEQGYRCDIQPTKKNLWFLLVISMLVVLVIMLVFIEMLLHLFIIRLLSNRFKSMMLLNFLVFEIP